MVKIDRVARVQKTDVLVLGGGLAGIAFRSAIPANRKVTLIEAAPELGGLLRVRQRGAYSFDSVPHVIFFRSRKLLDELRALLSGELHAFPRSNSIWQRGRRIPYPYQFNAASLAPDARRECLEEFRNNPHAGLGAGPDATFEEWLLGQFGSGFYRHFFQPYNEKLYGVPLDQLEAAPLRWTIPAENAEAVASGTGSADASSPLLYYPTGRQGISRVIEELTSLGQGELVTNCAAVRVDPERRIVETSTGETFSYNTLVSSLPLPELVTLMDPLPESTAAMGRSLHAVPITVLAIGATRTGSRSEDIWTYFPDPEIPFYRMTRLEQISSDLAPPGGTALLLECSGVEPPSPDTVLAWLDEHQIVPRGAVEHYESWHIPYAYVLFRRGYRSVRRQLLQTLAMQDIISIGRYGTWMYADIEMTMKSGISAARRMAREDRPSYAAERPLLA